MLDKKRRFNCVDCKGAGELKRVKFSLNFFESLACIMKIPSCVDNKADISCGRGRLSCSHLTELIGKVYQNLTLAAKAEYPLEASNFGQNGEKSRADAVRVE